MSKRIRTNWAQNRHMRLNGLSGYGWLAVSNRGVIYMKTNRVLFGDIDTEEDPQDRRASKNIVDSSEAIDTIATVAADHNVCFRYYQTFKGIRVLETSKFWDPTSDETQELLKALKCDNDFVALAKKYAGHWARLSPKPWRTDFYRSGSPRRFNFNYPDQDPDLYLQQPEYSIANYTDTAGIAPAALDPETEFIVNLHDQCCCRPDLPLA